jgi:DNA-directed RNA polymerase specialized sigma24 family protein
MIRSNSNSAKAINLVAKNFNLTAKEISTEIGVKMDSAHNLLYNARKKLRLFKVGRGKRATWKQKARMQEVRNTH